MSRFYEMWVSVVLVAVLGRTVLAAGEDGPMEHFKTFQACISNISLTSGSWGCKQSEDCLQTLFNASEQFLESNMENVKLEIQDSLDRLKHRCLAMFSEERENNILCQTEQIALCQKEAETIENDMCRQIKNMSDCLRPVNVKCFNRIFFSILRSISLGIWEDHKCKTTADKMGLGRDANWTRELLDEVEFSHVSDYEDELKSNESARSFDPSSNHTNSSFPKSRQGIFETSTHFSPVNVTTEEPTTTLHNSARIEQHYLSLFLPVLMLLIL